MCNHCPTPTTMALRGIKHPVRAKAEALRDMLKADDALLSPLEKAARQSRIKSFARATTKTRIISLG